MEGERIIRVAPLGGYVGTGVPARGPDRKGQNPAPAVGREIDYFLQLKNTIV
jgi:hypothetical protein